MKALIIGAAGFVGGYLADHLQKELGWEVYATKLEQEQFHKDGVIIYNLDILDGDAVAGLLAKVQPDFVFHLAAQSSVALSWKNPDLTIDVNIKGAVHVLDAVRELDYQPRVLLIGSAEEYGPVQEENNPVSEENGVHPGNIYAVTKVCQNLIGELYARAYQMDVVMVRAFNHIGPKQSPLFVVSDFCKQVAEIEKGLREPVMRVGNLSARRDFTDVRDIVKAYGLLACKGISGETYNVGSGKSIAIRDILNRIVSLSKVNINVEVDPQKLRRVDVPIIEAEIGKLTCVTGWSTTITLEQTLEDTLDYWREQV